MEPTSRNGGSDDPAEAAGQFDRTLTLPAEVDAAKVAAEYRDGVLTLRLPRAESAKPRTVTIN